MFRLAPLALILFLTACGQSTPLLPPDAILPDGSRYHGNVVDGLLQGKGRLDYADGSWFIGHFLDGQRHGAGEWHGANGEHYVGEFSAGSFDGQGTLKNADGSQYSGGFANGRFSGEGTLEEAGQIYRGQFRDGRFHGLGTLEQADGSRFQGRFVKGLPDGQGVREDELGNQLSGHFAGGQLKGAGNYRSSEGDSYDGELQDSLFHGKGRYQSVTGDIWSGTFVEGSLSGQGEYTGSDGSRYQGQFRDWRYQGEGRLQQADGSRFDGRFTNGRFHGEGTLTLADGTRQQGTWQRGLRVRDENGQALPDPLEIGLLKQGELLDQAITALPQSTPRSELYALTLAGDGKQSVFLREADYVANLLSERFSAYGRITLANHRDHLADRPLATRENLRRAVQAIAERSGPEDLVFIYLTSHGSRGHELNLDQPRLQLADLPADELATLLQPLADRHKVVVISACYSGGFIPALKDDKTLLMTAARADRVSFGCSEEADFTYFGRALFAEALQQTDDLQRAFDLASAAVAEREQTDGFEPSEPQIWAPPAVLKHWNALRQQPSEAAVNDKSAAAP
ncbi:peptidase C13 [Pseudomonas daroniae]|uniref:Peptidase C13 n=1 Tax=Phytopseudomonas daroniae TaxID=2487519 RepID=A0A4Q9QQA8_9GAMM|nr:MULTISPECIES: C13 family peptidase [Pseudomonas]TBU82745.1 peptidase C13 [Pseudomonas daroniae]TBU86055.1 peptidase C13 [Pseudomonas sp. FRB 228]TBU95218.1 peptidase C13 [Pseudomonas daroniae]